MPLPLGYGPVGVIVRPPVMLLRCETLVKIAAGTAVKIAAGTAVKIAVKIAVQGRPPGVRGA